MSLDVKLHQKVCRPRWRRFAIHPTTRWSAHALLCVRGFHSSACGRVRLACHATSSEQSEDETDAQRAVREAQAELAELRSEALPSSRKERKPRRRKADSSDPISSILTRRFGRVSLPTETLAREASLSDLARARVHSAALSFLMKMPSKQSDQKLCPLLEACRGMRLAGGLAWLGFLTFGVVSEQVKTRLENASEQQGTKDIQDAKEVALGGGLSYRDIRQGGGQAVQQGFLTVLHYKGFANSETEPFEDTKRRGKPIVYLFGSRPFTAGLCLGVEKGMAGMKAGGVRTVTVPPDLAFGDKGISLRGTGHAPDKAPQADVPPGATLRYELELVRVSIAPS